MKNKYILLTLLLFCYAAFANAAKAKSVFIPMDYSTCGYMASERTIPDVKNVIFVSPTDRDCSALLQRAIDYVSALKMNKDGFRGAILLGSGTFSLEKSLRISVSGVVIRGMDKNKTVLMKRGVDRGALIYVEGKRNDTVGDTIDVIEDASAGSTSLVVASIGKLRVGDRITVFRPSTKEWIADLKCNDFGGGLDNTGWKQTDIDINWSRKIVAIDGNRITIDAPITTSLIKKYGGGKVITGYNQYELTNCGIENLTLKSDSHSYNPKDEDHCWDGVWMENVRDCWVRRMNFMQFAGSAVNLQKNTSRITVEDCIADAPVSEVGGWRRCVFLTRGQQTLFQRCVSRHGIHDFAAGYCAAGPNAFVQCEAEESLGFSGSIGSWAAGLLFDIVNIDGNDLKFANLEQYQFGTGWNTANSMMWQCTAANLYCYSPSETDKCSANGCWGTFWGDGEWTESNNHVQPRSLFYDQLSKRMNGKSLNGFVLPRSTDASSSPALDEAQLFAKEALATPRLTMEMWQDSVPYTASVSSKGLIRANELKVAKHNITEKPRFAVTDGHITVDGKLVVGNKYDIPWWTGRTKDNFIPSSKPAITRYVPGREGCGWTDRIDSVVAFMKNNHYAILDHNYGLWYDLRRTDHERVRRMDGDVWAPFYEQPFARSGQGTAWDGLSRYDLTKPNLWYWYRLKEYAEDGAHEGLLLFHQNYFQHNILEAGAHWVDCPWRPVNNINRTDFPEPVPFTGDKRVFMAEYFYNENDPVLRPLHRQYIRQCMDALKDDDNVVQLISAEYTGPLHFTRFWLQTIAEWETETGRHPMIALSCTKDAQDSILADPVLNKIVDIIDIRYWHYNTKGLWAPPAGNNLAPRQFMRKMKVGTTGYQEVYQAVREYREKYPDKAVTFFAQQYPAYGWAILMGGGSCPNIPVSDVKFLSDVAKMKIIDTGNDECQIIGNPDVGYVIYSHSAQTINAHFAGGKYRISQISPVKGTIKELSKQVFIANDYHLNADKGDNVYWIEKM